MTDTETKKRKKDQKNEPDKSTEVQAGPLLKKKKSGTETASELVGKKLENVVHTPGKAHLILIDPPWQYLNKTIDGGAQGHYSTMSEDQLKALPISNKYANEKCVICMWVTHPMMPQALRLIDAWGFEFITTLFVWIKIDSHGQFERLMGSYTRSGSEFMILARRRGMKDIMKWKVDTTVPQVVAAERPKNPSTGKKEHSMKPEIFRTYIDRLFHADLDRLEIFGRKASKNWRVIGNEATKFDVETQQEEDKEWILDF